VRSNGLKTIRNFKNSAKDDEPIDITPKNTANGEHKDNQPKNS